ncbi:MAG: bis(5'-nucleosyl)-tetraphosphatase (symmetrical) YqeK, partial [Clostridiales bacterium]|nr:bis(5'-nucleosyl)-tetraphosphatase (symmetrical) YqeK [Clostridiales bacterium]
MYNQQIIDFLKEDIKKYESPKRAEHTLGVLSECEYFADKLGLDADERYDVCVAALLHDIAKDIPQKKKIKFCESENIPYSESAVHHQDMGGTLARKLYGSEIVSDAVFSAVSKHTTGSPDMSVCDMILYIADYTEPGRKYP